MIMKFLRGLALCLGLTTGPLAAGDGCVDVSDLVTFLRDHGVLAPLPDCVPVSAVMPGSRAAGLMLSQAGAYDPATDRIGLAPDLDLSSAIDRSFLLHELVHMAQFRNGAAARARCIGQLEGEAYALQAAYLRHVGEPAEAFMTTLIGQQMSVCPR